MPNPMIGVVTKIPSIAKWIKECMTDNVNDPTGAKASITHIAVCHQPGDKEIYVHPLKGTSLSGDGFVNVAETIHNRAESDAESLNGRQMYILYAFYTGFQDKPVRRLPIGINGRIIGEPGDATDQPTPEGRTMQRMRFDEAGFQMWIAGSANLINQYQSYGNTMADRANKAEERTGLMFEKMMEILAEMKLQSNEADQRRAEYARNTMFMEQAGKLLPMLLPAITGKQIVPQGNADSALIDALAENLDEESLMQLAPLLQKLPTIVQGALMTRMEDALKRKMAGQKRVEKAMGDGFSNGAADEEMEPPKH